MTSAPYGGSLSLEQEELFRGQLTNALPFGIGFLVCLSTGLFLVLRASLFQKSYVALLSRFPKLARLVPMKEFIASQGCVWLGRLVGVIFLVISVFLLFALLGALE